MTSPSLHSNIYTIPLYNLPFALPAFTNLSLSPSPSPKPITTYKWQCVSEFIPVHLCMVIADAKVMESVRRNKRVR